MQCSFLLTSTVLTRKPTFWYFLWASFQLSPNMMLKCLPMVLLLRCRSRCLQSQHLGVMAKGSRLLERDVTQLTSHCLIYSDLPSPQRALLHTLSPLSDGCFCSASSQSPWQDSSFNSFSPAVFSPPPTSPLMWSFPLLF